MYAVIEACGKQYKVEEKDVVFFEKLDAEEGKKVTFDKVILVSDDGKVQVGNPYVKGIEFLKNTQFYVEFEKCINLGMSVHAFNCMVQKGAIYLNEKLTIY